MANNELTHHGTKGMRWGIRRYQNKDGSLTPAGKQRRNSEERSKLDNIRKKKVGEMSNQELRDANQRLQLERQYRDLTKKKSKGKKILDAFIGTAGTITAATAAYGTYKALADKGIDKIGDWIIRDIKF